jgi:hypothetical protein
MSRVHAGLLVVLLAGCGSSAAGFADGGVGDTGAVPDSGRSGKDAKADSPQMLVSDQLMSISVSPASATLTILNGAIQTKGFTATAHYANDTSQVLSSSDGSVGWTVDELPIGTVGTKGLFTPTGTEGGVVHVTATYGGMNGSAALTVMLHVTSNPAGLTPAAEATLTGATTPDTSVVWAYPYDGTVFPRDLAAPVLMWNGGVAGDVYYVNVTSATFEYETFAAVPPPAAFTFDPTAWTELTNSTSGAATLTVKRLTAGNVATVVHTSPWTIAPAALRGAVYYWANNLGRVERIQPGAAMADDFANQAPLNDPTQYPKQSSCLMTCHTVSADGSTLISGGGTFGGSYNLLTDQPMNSLGGVWGWTAADGTTEDDWQNTQWMSPAISPDGKYLAVNGVAPQLALNQGATGGFEGLYATSDGTQIPGTGLESLSLLMPAWSPDGKLITFMDGTYASPTTSWDVGPGVGALQVLSIDTTATPMVSNVHDLVQPGSDPTKSFIAWPSVSPDSRWIVYQRGETLDTRFGSSGVAYTDNQSDLYLADAENPGVEIRLGKLDGDGYPFAAGARDVSLNYEPTFAPVASGGYFWVVFTSRRTYGNALTGDESVVKQLWVAAIDQTSSGSPTMPNDPSHAPFLLPGQDNTSLNMRGYFALPPCQANGASCASGTDCCDGYCNASGAAGGMVCASSSGGCSSGGDHCNTSADCCGSATGATCINHVCSEATPK